jgi:hypothetical protein
VQRPADLYTKGAIMRGIFSDKTSPLTYGYEGKELPIYFSQAPVLSVGARGSPAQPGGRLVQNITPNAEPVKLSSWGAEQAKAAEAAPTPAATAGLGGRQPTQRPRTIMQFPAKAEDILLSGMLSGGEALTNRALIVDVPSGKGHMVLYALRPFWRWQTQGSYFLGFNAILNWNNLGAGDPPKP